MARQHHASRQPMLPSAPAFNLSSPLVLPSRKQHGGPLQHATTARVAGLVVLGILAALLLLLVVWHSCSPATAQRLPQQRRWCGGKGGSVLPGTVGGRGTGRATSIWRRPSILLLGDSLTERGANEGGWGARLAATYRRKADVLNRGFGGYTTTAVLGLMPDVLDTLTAGQPHVLLATVLLGTNDASLPGSVLHVPLQAFASNLAAIVQQLLAAGVLHVVVATPPPIHEAAAMAAHAKSQTSHSRTYNTTASYAAAARAVAASLAPRVQLLDLMPAFKSQQDWQQRLLEQDGVHLTQDGNNVLFAALMQLIEQHLPDISLAALPEHHPAWRDINHQRDGGAAALRDEAAAFAAAAAC